MDIEGREVSPWVLMLRVLTLPKPGRCQELRTLTSPGDSAKHQRSVLFSNSQSYKIINLIIICIQTI